MVAEALAAIAERLAQLRDEQPSELVSGERAALWRAQQEAARSRRSLEDLRHYCLESLRRPMHLDAEHENDYLRGYRRGLQLVLREIRRIEIARRR
jgi:hypothetical protein